MATRDSDRDGARLHVRRLPAPPAVQRARAARSGRHRPVLPLLASTSRSSGRSCRPTWTRSRARRWPSCRPKKAGSASSTAASAPATSGRRCAKWRRSSARSTSSSAIPYAVAPETPLAEAVALMRKRRMGTLVVVDDQQAAEGAADRARRALRRLPTGRPSRSRMTPVDRAGRRRRAS